MDEYMTDEDGNIIFTKAGKPRRKAGRPKGAKSKHVLKREAKVEKEVNKRLKEQGVTQPTASRRSVVTPEANTIGEKRDYTLNDEERLALEQSYYSVLPQMLKEQDRDTLCQFLNKHSEVLDDAAVPMMDYIIKRAKYDFRFFARNFIKITDAKTEEDIPFVLSEAQEGMHLKNMVAARTGKAWTIIGKPRQIGGTTYTNARAVHWGCFHKGAYVIIMASKEVNSKKNLDRIRKMFKGMPGWFLNNYFYQYAGNTGEHKDSAGQLEFDSHITQSKAEYWTSTANGDATRGHQPNFVHWTETAFCDAAREAFTAISPALRKRHGSTFIIESTSNGLGNWYADTVLALQAGDTRNFNMFFTPWFKDPSNVAPLPREGFSPDEEELQLRDNHKLTDEQLYWRRLAIADENGDVNKFNQEYPIDVNSSFMTSDNIFYSEECIRKVEDTCMESDPKLLKIDDSGVQPHEFGTLVVHRQPSMGVEYVIGVDPAEGTVKGDFLVATVVDPAGNMVAQYRDKPTPEEAAAILNRLGKMYNNATLAIERGDVGGYLIRVLPQYFQYKKVMIDKDGRAGIKINSQSQKYELCTLLQDDVVNGVATIPSVHLAEEMKTFIVKDGNKKLGAKLDKHDDVIMSTVLAYHAKRELRPKYNREQAHKETWASRPKRRLSVR